LERFGNSHFPMLFGIAFHIIYLVRLDLIGKHRSGRQVDHNALHGHSKRFFGTVGKITDLRNRYLLPRKAQVREKQGIAVFGNDAKMPVIVGYGAVPIGLVDQVHKRHGRRGILLIYGAADGVFSLLREQRKAAKKQQDYENKAFQTGLN